MHIRLLRIHHLRIISRADLEPATGINLLVGDNGAGKTSVLEAIHLLASGRSFRSGARDALPSRGETELQVFCERVLEESGTVSRLGLARGSRGWSARLDGETLDTLTELFRELAVVCYEPGSHALISGGAEQRRRFVDWALFHVEPSFLPTWRRYQRALRQRNALLKRGAGSDEFLPWEAEMAESGVAITTMREHWLAGFSPVLKTLAERFLPELGEPRLRFQAGWPGTGPTPESLADALASARGRDQILGHSTVGPHRADWTPVFENAPTREMLSRGQEKLVVLCCLLAQAQEYARFRGHWPLLLFDDLASELDARHHEVVLDWFAQCPAQIFITGTSAPDPQRFTGRPVRVFHVEQGAIRPLV